MVEGIYATDRNGHHALVHEYAGSDYALADVVELFRLGRLEDDSSGAARLVLTMAEIRLLKTFADGFSFDHDQGFIEMCLDIHRFAMVNAAARLTFTANF